MKRGNFLLKYLIAIVLYGCNGLLVNNIDASSEYIAMTRGLVGFAVIVLSFFIRGRKIQFESIKRNFAMLVLSGIALGLNWALLFKGFKIAVSVATLCNYLAPIILIIISPILFKEKITLRQMICVAISLVGLLLISGVLDTNGAASLEAAGYGLGAAGCFVIMVIFNRKMTDIKPMEKSAVQLLSAAITMIPFVVAKDGFPQQLDQRSLICLLIIGAATTGFAYILYFDALTHITFEQIAVYGYLEPVIGVITSCIFLGEELTILSTIGAILIIGVAFEPLIGKK